MKLIPFLLALSVTSAALAHDTWIAPDQFTDACGAVTLHMTSAETFGKLEHAIDPGRVARAIVRIPGRRLNVKPEAAAHSADFHVDIPKSGVTIAAVELAPKTLELTPAQVAEYLDEIDAPAGVRAAWNAHPG